MMQSTNGQRRGEVGNVSLADTGRALSEQLVLDPPVVVLCHVGAPQVRPPPTSVPLATQKRSATGSKS